MIKKPVNWDNVKASAERETLPAGGYVVKIIGAKVAHYDSASGGFDRLEIGLDIAEGDYKDFYQRKYDANTNADRKWKGVLRQYLPKDDGSDKDEWTKSSLKAITEALEDSNPGYHWDWDETKMRGKTVGCLFRLEEWSVDGKKGWKANPFRFISADKVRKGEFKPPKFKAHKDSPDDTPDNFSASTHPTQPTFDQLEVDEGDLPFN